MFELAYFGSFIRTLLIILLVYYAIRFISRRILPLIFRSYMQDPRRSQNNDNRSQHRDQHHSQSRKKNDDDKLGEYVDFEEVD